MFAFIIGGSASGKSKLAEKCCNNIGGQLLYIATMRPYGKEALERIKIHKEQRKKIGFETLECYGNLKDMQIDTKYDAILLECAGNLVANEMFELQTPFNKIVEEIWQGIVAVKAKTFNFILVSNDIFADGVKYGDKIKEYVEVISQINIKASSCADVVVESVCGLPIVHKGEWVLG